MNKEIYLALGASLIFAGIILRGFARSARRARALRHQHWLQERKPGEAEPAEKAGGWLERNLGVVANTTVFVGVLVTLLAFGGP